MPIPATSSSDRYKAAHEALAEIDTWRCEHGASKRVMFEEMGE